MLAVIFLPLGDDVAGVGLDGEHALSAVVMIAGPLAPGEIALGGFCKIHTGDPGPAVSPLIVAACFLSNLHFSILVIYWVIFHLDLNIIKIIKKINSDFRRLLMIMDDYKEIGLVFN